MAPAVPSPSSAVGPKDHPTAMRVMGPQEPTQPCGTRTRFAHEVPHPPPHPNPYPFRLLPLPNTTRLNSRTTGIASIHFDASARAGSTSLGRPA